ncbi:MAG: Hpt domain-containing protein [Desulfocapsa sp.]|nr:Hpt domain-containing protein [Desulfocapsa sp.]
MKTQTNTQPHVDENKVSFESVCDHLVKRYEMERGQVEEIMKTYAGVLQKSLHKLQGALTNQDGKEGSCEAHTLKGALLNLGLSEQAGLASTLEKELGKKITPHHLVQVENLICELSLVTDRA